MKEIQVTQDAFDIINRLRNNRKDKESLILNAIVKADHGLDIDEGKVEVISELTDYARLIRLLTEDE